MNTGEVFAIASMTLFGIANVMIIRGFDGRTQSQGAFLSILITVALSAAIWFVAGFRGGFPAIRPAAVAWFALAGVLTIMIGRVFLYASIQSLGAVRGSTVKRLNPLFSVLLGVLILGESLSAGGVAGMLLIVGSFALLVHESLRTARNEDPQFVKQNRFERVANLGYVFGPVSALAYASGYVLRKQGLNDMPDAVFGTLVGALAGALACLLAAPFSERYRADVVNAFTVFNPWLMLAGISSTCGQIFYFAALKQSTVSKIALITSMEVFVTMFLTWLLYRSRMVITRGIIVAALLGVIGTVFIVVY